MSKRLKVQPTLRWIKLTDGSKLDVRQEVDKLGKMSFLHHWVEPDGRQRCQVFYVVLQEWLNYYELEILDV